MIIRSLPRPVRIFFLSLLVVLGFGCAQEVEHVEPLPEPARFLWITPEPGETLESLAAKYLGDSGLDWRIAEFNGIKQAQDGEELVVPLQSFRPGGLTAKGYQLVPVLAYHHFSKSNSRQRLIVGADKFESQARYLKEQGFHGINLQQFLEFLEFGQIPEKSVILSLDDGWESAYSIAYPIVKKYHLPVVLFIPTNVIHDRQGRILSWGQIREMIQDRTVDIQPHTKSHRDLTKQKSSESFTAYIQAIQSEMRGAKQIIREKLGRDATALSYPFGATNSLVSALSENEGYTSAFTVKRGGNPFFQNNFVLNRSMIYGVFDTRKFSENIQTFESFGLEEPEPIDESLALSRLDYRNPEAYENKARWRTASTAWKMHRDWLVHQLHGLAKGKENQTEKQVSELLARIQEADRKILSLGEKLRGIAADHYRAAMASSTDDNRRRFLLRSLLYDSTKQEPLRDLKKTNEGGGLLNYTVKSDDTTLQEVAQSVYRDKSKAVLIPVFNTQVRNDRDLKAGMALRLPHLPERIAVASSRQSGGNMRCGVDIGGKSQHELSTDFYTQAVKYFDENRVIKANASLKKALCLDPKNNEAKEMQELLEGL
ncbi:MAG: polysaccharide deacetylase family protein [Gammaproteobacteria bacterium]